MFTNILSLYHMSSVQKCYEVIYQGVNLWLLRERKAAGHESSRKSFTNEIERVSQDIHYESAAKVYTIIVN